MSEEKRNEISRIKSRKWFTAANRGVTFLRRRHERGIHERVSSKRLKEVCGVQLHKHWSGVLILIKEILLLQSLDLTNRPGEEGYSIAWVPEMTLREVIKSVLRAFSHFGSAKKRRDRFAESLKGLTPPAREALNTTDSIINVMIDMDKGSTGRNLRNLIARIEELSDANDDVSNPMLRLLDEREPEESFPIRTTKAFDNLLRDGIGNEPPSDEDQQRLFGDDD